MTNIEWTDETWNPTRGCSRVSPGCVNCYAERVAVRFEWRNVAGEGGEKVAPGPFHGFITTKNGHPAWTGKVELIESKLLEPLRWKKSRRVFVNSMSDLFHESLDPILIDRVFAVMALCPQHTFQILTKRADVMRAYVNDDARVRVNRQIELWMDQMKGFPKGRSFPRKLESWPLPNVWLGVSAENQEFADKRVPLLLETPAAIRFVSYEPALGPVDFDKQELLCKTWRRGFTIGRYLDWIIVGGESGPGARPFDIAWARNAVKQCKYSGTACFVKQLGADPYDSSNRPEGDNLGWRLDLKDRKGGDPSEWPADLRVRQFPRTTA